MNNKQTYHPLSFISTVSGKIDTLLESLESKHKSEKNITKKIFYSLKKTPALFFISKNKSINGNKKHTVIFNNKF